MSRIYAFALCVAAGLPIAFPALEAATKKPITVESFPVFRRGLSSGIQAPEWSPDGGSFLFVRSGKLMLYRVAEKREAELVSLGTLEEAAKQPAAPERYGWQNRRVQESRYTWSPNGDSVLISEGGDLFLLHLDSGKWTQLTATPEEESDAKLSPDGRQVAFRTGNEIFTLDLAGGERKRLTFDATPTRMNGRLDWVYPEELDLGTAFWWAPDSKSIAYMQFDVSREFVYPQVDLLGLRAVAEPERYPQAGTPNASVKVGVVNCTGAEPATQWIDLGPDNEALIARVDWIPDSGKLAIQRLNRVQNHLDLLIADPSNGRTTTVVSESDKYWINISNVYRFLPGGTEFLWSSERDGFRHLYLYRVDGTIERRLTQGNWEVTALVGADSSSRRAYFVSTEASPLERQLYSVGFDGGGLRRISKGAGTHAVNMSPDCKHFLDSYSNLSEPASLTLRTEDGGEVAVLHRPSRKLLDEYEIPPTEILQVPSSSGVTFYAALTKPANYQAGKKYPLVVMVYGGPGAQSVVNSWRNPGLAQVLAARGFLVWQLDNRGSVGRGHAFETPIYHRFGKTELADQLEGIRYLENKGLVDSSRIAITGWSYGGFMTIYSLLNAPDVFRLGIAGAPVTNWRNYDTIYTERYLGLPSEDADGYRNSSDVTYASQLKSRLLIVHNVEDDNVLFQNSMQMADALERAGKDFRMVVYPQKTHGVQGPASKQMYESWLEMFDELLKP